MDGELGISSFHCFAYQEMIFYCRQGECSANSVCSIPPVHSSFALCCRPMERDFAILYQGFFQFGFGDCIVESKFAGVVINDCHIVAVDLYH